jgi:YHS domain-containing protein
MSMRDSTSKEWCFTENLLKRRAMKVIDPVCGVQTDTEKAVAQEDYGGRTFFFCSEECHRLFRTSPERYVGEGSNRTPVLGQQPK